MAIRNYRPDFVPEVLALILRLKVNSWESQKRTAGREITKSHYLMEDSSAFYQCLTNGTLKSDKLGREPGQGQAPAAKGCLWKPLSSQGPNTILSHRICIGLFVDHHRIQSALKSASPANSYEVNIISLKWVFKVPLSHVELLFKIPYRGHIE